VTREDQKTIVRHLFSRGSLEKVMETTVLNAYLVDDEPLAIERLKRLLGGFPSIRIAGSATDAAEAFGVSRQRDGRRAFSWTFKCPADERLRTARRTLKPSALRRLHHRVRQYTRCGPSR